ncbi:expressed unknown protein [Seminavis robusta]|uniref:Uncharacterized protein n=1 Tax=Seminavis robusta TaxID=568900 RepID=A0A9N8DPY0_9STRA|nr:expressed unknown protein [Seminavis robusta]|eukprot:Sro271_g104600.1 n/a (447) ;mRNA; f:50536-51876
MQAVPNDHDDETNNNVLDGNPHDTEAVLDISLSEQGARALSRHLPNVETLYIRSLIDEDDDNNNHVPINNHNRPAIGNVTDEQIVSMFSILGDHQRLRHLVLDNLDALQEDDRVFPLEALTVLVQKARHLKSLQLDMDVAISGTPVHGRAFLLALRQHSSLETLELTEFGNARSTILASEFSPLMVPNRWKELSLSGGQQITDQQVDIAILQSQALTKLLVDSNGDFQRHLSRVLEALQNQQCQHLHELVVLDDLTEQTALDFASMIRHNHRTLQYLFLSLGIQSRYGTLITEALLHNNHIHSIRFVMSGERNGDATALVHHLRHNRTLKRIHIHFQGLFSQDRVNEVFLKPFLDILREDNYTLERIKLDKCHSAFSLSREVEFFLQLNRAGRNELLESTINSNINNTRTDVVRRLWANKIIQHRSNVNVVFYFLLQNPSFLPATV